MTVDLVFLYGDCDQGGDETLGNRPGCETGLIIRAVTIKLGSDISLMKNDQTGEARFSDIGFKGFFLPIPVIAERQVHGLAGKRVRI